MTINFEEDQQDIIKNTGGVQSLADQVERLEAMQKQLEIQEEAIKEKKNKSNIYQERLYLP